ncbi:DUF2528 family protein [Pseudomonas typographi]|uniref:DUF2528 family protein n=1 Tax=Pseudomonas typographi TaxID=2715964 RepID=UPI001686A998|nr:DUF2528 family protein [Pseudomonas typographi]MBD1555252.1 DUF2528 family protein [Pseudomonas typographi]
MSNLKKYKVDAAFKDCSVTLEVDHDKLTTERAREHLRFWSGAEAMIDDEDRDAVRAAIRDFGVNAMYHMLGDLGASFSGGYQAERWSKELREMEGYGGEDGTPHGWIGIRVLAADAESPGWDDCELEESAQ